MREPKCLHVSSSHPRAFPSSWLLSPQGPEGAARLGEALSGLAQLRQLTLRLSRAQLGRGPQALGWAAGLLGEALQGRLLAFSSEGKGPQKAGVDFFLAVHGRVGRGVVQRGSQFARFRLGIGEKCIPGRASMPASWSARPS